MPTISRPLSAYASSMSRRTGVSHWHGGHQRAQKLSHTSLPRRSSRRTGLPSRSVSWNVLPSPWVTRELGRLVAGLEPLDRRAHEERGRCREGRGAGPGSGRDRPRDEREHDGRDDDDHERRPELARGERPDERARGFGGSVRSGGLDGVAHTIETNPK